MFSDADDPRRLGSGGLEMPAATAVLCAGVPSFTVLAEEIDATFHRFKYGVMIGAKGETVMLCMAAIHGRPVDNVLQCSLFMALYNFNGGKKMVRFADGIAVIISAVVVSRVSFDRLLRFPGGPRLLWRSGAALTWGTNARRPMLNLPQFRS
jgi:uncharacterized membrane protein YecN with MAPEG domain